MSIPNLGALRLDGPTAPTSELWPITKEDAEAYWEGVKDKACGGRVDEHGKPELQADEREYGVRRIRDPCEMHDEGLPFGKRNKSFRTPKDPNHPERGWNWHDPKVLARWVRTQIVEKNFPVVDPLRVRMRKSDIEELRFEVDPTIPPYDPERDDPDANIPPGERYYDDPNDNPGIRDHQGQPNVVVMSFEAEREYNYREIRPIDRLVDLTTVTFEIRRTTNPELFEALAKFFRPVTLPRESENLDFGTRRVRLMSDEINRDWPSRGVLQQQLERTMRNLATSDAGSVSGSLYQVQEFEQLQIDLRLALRNLGAWLMRSSLGDDLITPEATCKFKCHLRDHSLRFGWSFYELPLAFYEAMASSYRFTAPVAGEEPMHRDPIRTVLHEYQTLFTKIVWNRGRQLGPTPRLPVFTDRDTISRVPRGQYHYVAVTYHFDVLNPARGAEIQLPVISPEPPPSPRPQGQGMLDRVLQNLGF